MKINKLGIINFNIGKINFLYIPIWCWQGTFFEWIYTYQPDNYSWYLVILGWELNYTY